MKIERVVSTEDKPKLIEWIKQHRNSYQDAKSCFKAAQEAVLVGKPHLALVSSSITTYMRAAGFAPPAKVKPELNGQAVSAVDAIHRAQKAIKDALEDLEQERNQLHNRIVEIDNLVAKYSKLL